MGDPKKGQEHHPILEKIKPFLVVEPASWHVSLEESRKTGKPAFKFGFCLAISRMIPGHFSSLRPATTAKIKLSSFKSCLGLTLEPFIVYL